MLKESCGRVEFDIEITEPSCSHTNEKSTYTVVWQTNVTLPKTLAVMILGLIETVTECTKSHKRDIFCSY